MKTDNIKEIQIDDSGRLCVFPEKERFTMIYRLAKEVDWDNDNFSLYSPRPREWSYFDWYKHIIDTTEECGCKLSLTVDTLWTNVPDFLKQQIMQR